MKNIKGFLRDRTGTLLGAIALTHCHLLRMALRGKKAMMQYARPVFQAYVQSLNPSVHILALTELLDRLEEVHGELLNISLPRLQGYVGLTDWERVTLASLVQQKSELPCFEIGTAAGSTTVLMAHNTAQVVYTLDLPDDFNDDQFALTRMHTDDQVIAGRVRASLLRDFFCPNAVELIGDSANFDYSPYHGRIGFFFIDGAHSYEYVRSDTQHACQCLAPGGIIAWHDFGSSRDVSRFLNEMAATGIDIFAVERTTVAISSQASEIYNYLTTKS